MPRLNKPAKKIPAKTHSGLSYRFTFSLFEADSKTINQLAINAGLTPDQYCKRVVLHSFGKKRVNNDFEQSNTQKPEIKTVATPKKAVMGACKIAVPVASLLLLRERRDEQKLSPALCEYFERLIDFFDRHDGWVQISALQLSNKLGGGTQTVANRLNRYVACGLLDIIHGGGSAKPNKYRLPILSKYTDEELRQRRTLNPNFEDTV